MPERDELDRLIDSELARYAEPREGLEQRVLARVSAEGSKRVWALNRWQYWALAGVAAALIITMVVVPLSRNAHRETAAITARATAPDRGSDAIAKSSDPESHIPAPHLRQGAKTADNAMRKTKSVPLRLPVQRPKLDVFPAPQPLSAQERALAELTTRLPKAERQRLFRDNEIQGAPLEISAIKISPITMPDVGKN